MGLLIFVWGIYTELQNCISNGPWPLPFPITGGRLFDFVILLNIAPLVFICLKNTENEQEN